MTPAFKSKAFQNSGFQVDPVTGVIYAIDQDDTCNLVGTVTGGSVEIDMHDGFTKEEVKRIKKLQKKIAQAEADKIQARREKSVLRKQQIRDLVDPTQVKVTKVKSEAEVKIVKPTIDTKRINAVLANLERQKQELLQAVAYRNELVRVQTQLAILEAKARADELDDEEALLMLL